MAETLVNVENLKVHFPVEKGTLFRKTVGHVRAVDGIDFSIYAGETLGLVGESGCGKSTTGRALLRLIEPTLGRVMFQGRDITKLSENNLRRERMNFQMIFQDPYASLNPRMTVGSIVAEPLRVFGIARGKALERRVHELLQLVGLDPKFIRRYPHEFSGGQRQRIGIARALALNPKFIVADEPISALDVSIQAQILNLLMDLQQKLKLTYLFIAHDLAAVRHISNRVAVMYLGKIVEIANHDEIYLQPEHPYTQALLSAVPIPDPQIERQRKRVVLKGEVPSPLNPPSGCRFHTRCPYAMPHCATIEPPLKDYGRSGHLTACHLMELPKPPHLGPQTPRVA
ncbi:MAG: peptide ABC transporter substrate-binding protein [Deltaproteobacteria bacterium RIFCSPLOWO2_02_FULL_44_10]|nr:MAG: peptide ABC transporter substrate-binding protein [Deltaproteobacteria bacterium RIFCSPHIGHO2_02_FULL_44_16]OGQ47281.1 MAG: peptide ABC transporter substrate-binding protein [Deltaproteobacteria bacterium RIFCSPLOWO2_02_FULL_44_10]